MGTVSLLLNQFLLKIYTMIDFDFLISDTHFGHTNIIKYCDRPFKDCDQMLEVIVNNYNNLVSHSSKVLFMGDIFFTGFDNSCDIMHSLNGSKYLLRGNHDKRLTDSQFARMGFVEIYGTYQKTKIDGSGVYLSHYPFNGYSKDNRYGKYRPPIDGTVIVHGHTHDKHRLTLQNTVHIGVDAWDFGPAPIGEVSKLVKKVYEKALKKETP